MKTLYEFQAQEKTIKNVESSELYEGTKDAEKVHVYDCTYEILELKDGSFGLSLMNKFYVGSLYEMESYLWDFVKHEINVSLDDITEDLHERCSDIIESMNQKYNIIDIMSLDEYISEYGHLFSKKDLDFCLYLCNQF